MEVTEKTRLKNLKQLVLEDLKMKDHCAIRLYSNGVPLIGDMDLLKDLNLTQVEAELYYSIHVQVEGMGGQYQRQIEVSPNDTIDSIRNKVHFFSLFSQRNYKLVTESGTSIERDQLTTLKFRDSGLVNGQKLIMKPPQRERQSELVSQRRPQNEESDRESEAQEVAEGEEGFAFAGEGGEDEMVEMQGEGGEFEI